MARIKYAEGITKLTNEHQGYTFQNSRSANVMMKAQANDRARQLRRQNRQVNLMSPAGRWRNLSPSQQAAWNLFATTYPQPAKRKPDTFLTGYQLFLKRCQYCHLNYSVEDGFIFSPPLEELPAFVFTPTIEQAQNVLDVTVPYIKQFGVIPSAGQWLFFKAVPMAVKTGQFFPAIKTQLQVIESYIDGLFVSLELPPHPPDVVISVFLSKPINQSTAYQGTKTRYMGCFTSKTFLQLTDTPDSYAGQAGKVVTVREDETGLEFSENGGGSLTCETIGACPTIEEMNNAIDELIEDVAILNDTKITCADLPECPTIININDTLQNIIDTIITDINLSIPPVKMGLLYNQYAAFNAAGLSSSPDWVLCPDAVYLDLAAYAGGVLNAGALLKEIGLVNWSSPNTGATNSLKLNLRGAGFRFANGIFSALFSEVRLWDSYFGSPTSANYFFSRNNSTLFNRSTTARNFGHSVRLIRTAVGVPDLTIGSYVGNNGRIYRTIVINEIEHMADNLAETEYRDHSPIPEITANAAWTADTAGAMCAYSNQWFYV